MDYYINLQFRADDEVPMYFIRNKVFAKLHKTLYDLQQATIGVSFPNYKRKLGDQIRLHGSKVSLATLHQSNWLGGLAGYCETSDILPVPESIEGYRTVSRIRQNMTNAKLKRLIKRGSIPEENVKNYKARMFATGLDNPYLELQSQSTGKKYRLYIAIGDLHDQPTAGEYNHFGLSNKATVPWFS